MDIEKEAKKLSKEIIKEMMPVLKNELKKEIIKDIKKEKEKKIYHNTYVLMKHYNQFKNHVTEVVIDGKPVDYEVYKRELEINNKMIICATDEKFINSILSSKIRTATIVAFIDEALKILRKDYRKKHEYDKYRAFELYFIKGKTNKEISEKLYCSINTPKKWSNQVLKDLSLLLFGIDALTELIA